MNLNKNFNINSCLYSLFHNPMTKTNYEQLENFKRIEKRIKKNSVNPMTAFDQKYMKKTIIQFKNKKILKVHPLNFEKVFN